MEGSGGGGASGAAQHSSRPGAAASVLERCLDAEKGRWFYWLPVFFGLGAAIYFALDFEPSLALAASAALAAGVLRVYMRDGALKLLVSSIALACALGFVTAKLRTQRAAAPILQKEMRNATVRGWAERWERGAGKRGRLTVRVTRIDRLAPGATPYRVRLTLGGEAGPPPGAPVVIRARLQPPPEPVAPGAFDFARQLYYLRIGAVGYGSSRPAPEEGRNGAGEGLEKASGWEDASERGEAPWDLKLGAAVERVRQAIAGRVGAVLDGAEGAVAKALIMGDQRETPQEVADALRNAGLFHVLSISGLHMSLIAGALYGLTRGALALWPRAALCWPIRKGAALAAGVGAFAYLLISGQAVAAQRAFIMVAVLFLAIILGRPAITLRNVAFSAGVILVLAPESVLDAGFQMSFAAVTALVALYEGRRFFVPLREGPLWRRAASTALSHVGAVSLTTVAASVAVFPFSAYHFHAVQPYAVLGNLLGLPLVTYVIMPMALASLFAMPLGLERWPLLVMGAGLDALFAVARWVGGLPGAAGMTPSFPAGALTLMTFGGLWLCLWGGRWRYGGVAVFALGLATIGSAPRPDVLIGRDGDVVAVRGPRGDLSAPPGRKGGYSLDRWLEADGDARKAREASKGQGWRCDAAGCATLVKGRVVSLALHPSALADDCDRADILIAPLWLDGMGCVRRSRPPLVIDRRELWENGAHALYLEGGRGDADGRRMVLTTVAGARGERPWVISRRRKRELPAAPPVDALTDSAASVSSVSEDR